KCFKFLLLTRSFLPCPCLSGATRDGFDSPRSRRNRFFLYNPKQPDFAGRTHVRAAAEFHRVTIERARRSADLQHAYGVTVFLAEKLNDVFPLLRFGEG